MKRILLVGLALAPLLAGFASSADPVVYLGERHFTLIMNGSTFNGMHYPDTPLLEAYEGEKLNFIVVVPATAETHVFHIHGHPWYDNAEARFLDAKLMNAGDVDRFNVTAGAPGDWMYHCHLDNHFQMGMWGILRIYPRPSTTGDDNPGPGHVEAPSVPRLGLAPTL